jgi:hypothetical protein
VQPCVPPTATPAYHPPIIAPLRPRVTLAQRANTGGQAPRSCATLWLHALLRHPLFFANFTSFCSLARAGVCSAMLSAKPSVHASAADAPHLPQESKVPVPTLNLGVLSRAAPPVHSARTTFASARSPQKPKPPPTTPRAKVPQTSRDPPTPDVHHQQSFLRPPALLSSARSAQALEQSFRPSFSRIDERIDMRPFSEAGTSMIGSEELGRVQSSLLKHVPVGGHRHYSQVAEETTQRFTAFADLMAVSCALPHL